jgi:aldehyde dehydrogenase (NAD+)
LASSRKPTRPKPGRPSPQPPRPSPPGACPPRSSASTSSTPPASRSWRKAELGDLLAREEGKTLPEAIGEVARAGNIFKFFAGEALRVGGDVVPSGRPGVGVEVTREPAGVVGLITPWNFPIAIPAWKIAPALACGNAVVLKPADLVPGSAWAIADILHRAGLPAGVFNLVMGHGSEVGQVLLDEKRISAISFTGSVVTGQRIAQACVARMAKFQLEMGGKNPMWCSTTPTWASR